MSDVKELIESFLVEQASAPNRPKDKAYRLGRELTLDQAKSLLWDEDLSLVPDKIFGEPEDFRDGYLQGVIEVINQWEGPIRINTTKYRTLMDLLKNSPK